jgi:hypothetical protein
MNTPMKLLSILGVLLRWAFWGDEGSDRASDAAGSLPAGSRFSETSPGIVP